MNALTPDTLPAFTERLRQIRPDSRPRWGSLTPVPLMSHLRCMVELSLEEQSLPDYPMPLSKTPLFRWLMLRLPWPKGAKAPESAFPPPSGTLDEEREKLIAALGRFAEALARDPRRKTRSPLLGPVTLDYWSRLHAKHLAHHLKQFGC